MPDHKINLESRWRHGWPGHGRAMVLPYLLTALCVALAGCSKKAAPEAAPTVRVQVAIAEKTSIQHKVSGDAVLYPLNQASMVPKISAPIKKYYVNRGSHVTPGELVALLENQDLLAATAENKGGYEQAQAAYETTTKATVPEAVTKAELDLRAARESLDAQQKVYESRQALYKQGAISRKEVDDAAVVYIQAKNQYAIAKQHLESLQSIGKQQDLKSAAGQLMAAQGKYQGAQAQLSYTEIRSPISGVVTDRPLNLGEMAAVGSPVITVMDISQVIARTHIAQQEAAFLRVGDSATITAPGIGDQFPGKVTMVSPALDPNSTTVEVWVQAPNRAEQLKPGTSVRVTIVAETVQNAIVIPTEALLTAPDGAQSVIIAVGDKPVQKPVKAGIKDEENVQIISGLSGGERVITVGAFELSHEDPDVLAKTKLQIQVSNKHQ
ncbi:MAG TPA: efflux RND transporter periplasmic adaptor subunit [Terriglobia bacterium]|nr:efflux RND transporter periplasmic adaptor subunit [Terriglobia bacterium]